MAGLGYYLANTVRKFLPLFSLINREEISAILLAAQSPKILNVQVDIMFRAFTLLWYTHQVSSLLIRSGLAVDIFWGLVSDMVSESLYAARQIVFMVDNI